jgi:hypothetical protein
LAHWLVDSQPFFKPFHVHHEYGRAADLDFDWLRQVQLAGFHHWRHWIDELRARRAVIPDQLENVLKPVLFDADQYRRIPFA